MDLQMSDTSGLGDKKLNRKRRTGNLLPLDSNSIQKRLRSYPSNASLLYLNDYCLLEVFKYLNQIDLCRVHNACTRFVPLAEDAFKYTLKRKLHWTKVKMEEPTSDIRLVLYKFGHLYKSLHICNNIDSDILERLTQITLLRLIHVDIDSKIFRVIHTAQNLNELIMADCKFVSSSETVPPVHNSTPRNLKSLVGNKKSPLLRLTFQSQQPPVLIFNLFLQFNQQLECLGLPINDPESVPFYVNDILKHAKQLSELNFFTSCNGMSTDVRNMLSNLTNLRRLAVIGNQTIGMCAAPLLEGIEQNAPKLTHLEIREFIFKETTLGIISQMKNLQHLALGGMFDCLKTELVSLVASLPLLNNLILSLKSCCLIKCGSRNVHFNILKKIVEEGKKLNVIKFLSVREIQINENNYAELLKVLEKGNRKEKISIAIVGCAATTGFKVPMQLQRINEKCLTIDYCLDRFCSCIEKYLQRL